MFLHSAPDSCVQKVNNLPLGPPTGIPSTPQQSATSQWVEHKLASTWMYTLGTHLLVLFQPSRESFSHFLAPTRIKTVPSFVDIVQFEFSLEKEWSRWSFILLVPSTALGYKSVTVLWKFHLVWAKNWKFGKSIKILPNSENVLVTPNTIRLKIVRPLSSLSGPFPLWVFLVHYETQHPLYP